MIQSILGDYRPMLETILTKLNSLEIDYSLCDHICYRVTTEQRYKELQNELLSTARLEAETLVSGRLISIFKLNEAIIFKNIEVKCLELPAPKDGSSYIEGYEHAEFVITNLDEFMKKHMELPFKKSAMGRQLNPELGLKISDKYQVKFHPLDILEVIQREKAAGITEVE